MGYLESVPVRAELGQRNRMQLFLLDFLEANFQSLSNFSIEGLEIFKKLSESSISARFLSGRLSVFV